MLMWSLLVEMVEKFGAGAMVMAFGGLCALCERWLRPLAAILGSAEDLSRPPSSGGRGVELLPGAVNSCLEGRSACKTPSNLLFSTPNGLNVSPGRVESLFENIQSLGGFSWLALPSSCILFTHLLSSVSPCQLPTTNADVNQFNNCILEVPRHGTSTLILPEAASLKDLTRHHEVD